MLLSAASRRVRWSAKRSSTGRCRRRSSASSDHGNAGDRQRQRRRLQRHRADRRARVGHDLDRAHRGEMMRDDGERKQERRDRTSRADRCDGSRPARRRRRTRCRAAIERDDERRRPIRWPGSSAPTCRYSACRRCRRRRWRRRGARASATTAGRHAEPVLVTTAAATSETRGQTDVVCGRDAGLVGQHRDEMRRPDAATGHHAGGQDPGRARAAARSQRAVEQADRRRGSPGSR